MLHLRLGTVPVRRRGHASGTIHTKYDVTKVKASAKGQEKHQIIRKQQVIRKRERYKGKGDRIDQADEKPEFHFR